MFYSDTLKVTIHFIRHGMTEANEKRLYCGQTDIPLSEYGREELFSLKQTVDYPSSELFATSGLSRAEETLKIIYGDAVHTVLPELGEINFGDFEMKSHDLLVDNSDYQRWIGDIDNECPPNGETKQQFVSRVQSGFIELLDICHSASVTEAVVVTHKGVIATLLEQLFPEKGDFYHWQPKNGRGYSVCIDGKVLSLTEI